MKLFITELDAIARETISRIAERHAFDSAAFDVACSVRLGPDTLFHVERWQCDRPRILCNARALLAIASDRKAKHRWESGALKAIIGAIRMLRTSALLSPEQAIEIRAARLESRRIAAKFKPLPPRYFATSAIVTVTDRLTGQSITDSTRPGESFEECQSRLRQSLSIQILRSDEAAELVDTIEAARTFQVTPAPTTVTVSADADMVTYNFNGE